MYVHMSVCVCVYTYRLYHFHSGYFLFWFQNWTHRNQVSRAPSLYSTDQPSGSITGQNTLSFSHSFNSSLFFGLFFSFSPLFLLTLCLISPPLFVVHETSSIILCLLFRQNVTPHHHLFRESGVIGNFHKLEDTIFDEQRPRT